MSNDAPVVFVHGLWLHSLSWDSWVGLFNASGYDASAPGWPGDSDTVAQTRQQPEQLAGYGINEIVDHYAKAISELDSKPIVIGHSFGGLIAQRLLAEGHAAAAVALDAAPIKGVLRLPFSALRVASVALRKPGNRKGAVSLTQKQFRYGFGNALPELESNQLYEKWAIPSPGRPLFEDASATFSSNSPAKVDTANAARGPLLLVAGGKDHTVPASVTRQTLKLYMKSPAVTDFKEFPDRGHSLGIDSGWEEVAETSLTWLKSQSL